MMLSIKTNDASIKQVAKILKDIGLNARKEIATAVNKAGEKTRSTMAKGISKKITIKQKDVKNSIGIKKANETSLTTSVTLKKEKRLGLQYFGAVQDEVGVSYQIVKGGERKYVDDAFMGTKPGRLAPKLYGNVFKRKGKSRLPIIRLKGPSFWGIFVKNKLEVPTAAVALTELEKQVRERLRYLLLKAQNKLKGKQR